MKTGTVTKKKSLITYSIVFVIIPMLIGAILYYIFCSDVWFVKMIDGCLWQIKRPSVDVLSNPLLRFIRYYAFDFIWAFAMTNALFIVVNNNAKPILICLTIPVALGGAMEILQLLGIAQGTSDILDVVAEGLGSTLGVIIINYFRRLYK